MISHMATRPYTLKRRAERQNATRARIVEATAALHQELGPGRTTISAIARRAGVERLTVYRHFPDDTSLFQACSGHYFAVNPPPDLMARVPAEDAAGRTREALTVLYRYYRGVAPMFTSVLRDAAVMPEHRTVLTGAYDAYLEDARGRLLASWAPSRRLRRRVSAALAHALRFETWRSLADEGLEDGEVAETMAGMIGAIAE
jgi:AcrR family transcriptional regulator